MRAKCILGTAQLGSNYGVANQHGQPDEPTARKIVATALRHGICYFDTAQAYGNSEEVLGRVLHVLNATEQAKIITKLVPRSLESSDSLKSAVDNSVLHLGIEAMYCLMLHEEKQLPLLDHWQGEFLQELVGHGRVQKIGISVYGPEAALEALNHPRVDVVQIPSNIFDRRFVAAGVFETAKALKKEIHVRSVFLQGVLCMLPDSLPEHFSKLRPALTAFLKCCIDVDCTPSQAALCWMQYHHPEVFLIFGAETPFQVQSNMDFIRLGESVARSFFEELDALDVPQSAKLFNPDLWPR